MGILGGVGAAQAFAGASGGKVYSINTVNETTLTSLVVANPNRVSITFHNPGAKDIFVGPSFLANGASNLFTNAALGGSFRVFANGGTLTITGECQLGWNALAITGAGIGNPLTVMESNV